MNIGPAPLFDELHANVLPDHDCHDICAPVARPRGQGVEAHLVGPGHVALAVA